MVCLSALCACLCVRGAAAGLAFPSVVERIVGTRVDIAPVRAALSDSTARMRIDAHDVRLYQIDGLRTTALRASGTRRNVFLTLALVNLDSPVGSDMQLIAEGGYVRRGVWQGAVRAGVERLSLADTPPYAWRVAGVASRVDVGRVTTVADVELLDGDGPGYDSSLSLSARVRAGAAQLIANVRIDGDRFVGAGIAVVARLDRTLALLAGYDDGSESMRAGVVIDWRGVEVGAGVFQHPVLGTSQGVSVACFR